MAVIDALSSASAVLDAELAAVRAALQHAGQKGASLEGFVSRLLQRHLPNRLGVTEGLVVSSDGFRSRQIDLIIYDKDEAPLFFNNGYTKVVPIEFVYAVIEVKACLTKASFLETAESHAELKRARKYLQPDTTIEYTYFGYGERWKAPPISSFILSFECSVSPDVSFSWYRDLHSTKPMNECVDVVLINPTSLMCRGSEEIGFDINAGTCKSLFHVRDNVLRNFLGLILVASTGWRMHERALFFRYFHGPTEDVTEVSSGTIKAEHSSIINY